MSLYVKETAGILRVHRKAQMAEPEDAVIGTLQNSPGILRWFRYAGDNKSLTLEELKELVDMLENEFKD